LVLGDKIRRLRTSSKMTLKELAQLANISISYLGDIEKGRSTPSLDTLLKLAHVLGTTPGYLLSEDFVKTSEDSYQVTARVANIPILKDAMANGVLSKDYDYNYEPDKQNNFSIHFEQQTVLIDDHTNIDSYFLYIAPDNSMSYNRINQNDKVLVKRQASVNNGELAVILLPNSQPILRRIYFEDGYIILQSENPEIPPIIIESPEEINVLGKAVKVISDLS